ncbi:MAG: NTPase [Nitrospirae bacterium]|nr:NTPase [Nitrospirota bacterium]
MTTRRPKILLTGRPGCGKTTVIRACFDRLERPAVGFYTEEIREQGERVGFRIQTLDEKTGVLAHVSFKGPHRVGRYGVDVAGFEALALPALQPPTPETIIIIDEIGKMECFSEAFQRRVLALLDGPNPFLATIALKGPPFIQRIRTRPDVEILEVTPRNRTDLPDQLSRRLLASR